ncbi:MAG: hypothetical protein V1798_11800 [Pseudomonadota bacterium]
MKNWIAFGVVMFGAWVLQTSLLAGLFLVLARGLGLPFLAGQTVNLALLTLIYLSLHRDVSGTLIWAVVIGFVGSWFGTTWNGALTSSFFLVSLVCGGLRRNLLLKDDLTVAVFAGAMVLVQAILQLGAGEILNQIPGAFEREYDVIIGAVLVTGAAAPVWFRFLRAVDALSGAISQRSRTMLLSGL